MKIEEWLSEHKKLVAVILLSIVVFFLYNQIWAMQSAGYLTATQGLQAEFHSLCTYGKWLSNDEKPSTFTIQDRTLSAETASNWFFGYELNFDPDEQHDGFPNLLGSQQPIALDLEVEPKHYGWEVDKGIVTLSNGTTAKKIIQFEMWRYKCDWRVNVWLSGPEAESCDRRWDGGIAWEPNYGGVDIWIRLKPRAFVYFKDNPDEVYFAPAYIALTGFTVASIDKDGKLTIDDPEIKKEIDLYPKAKGETLGIYYTRGGGTSFKNLTSDVLVYEGTELDPEIFRDEYWIHISLLNFKPRNTVDFWTKAHSWWYPSIQLDFKVYVLVVGKWTVYLTTEEVEELQPHEPIVVENNPWQWIADWWGNPMTQIWLLLFMGFIALVVLAVFAPGVLTVVSSLLVRRRKE